MATKLVAVELSGDTHFVYPTTNGGMFFEKELQIFIYKIHNSIKTSP